MDNIGQVSPAIANRDMDRMSRLANEAERLEAKAGGIDKGSKLFEVCKDFEALFIKQMLDVMRKTVKKEGILEGGFGQEIFEDMLYDEYSKKMAHNARLGIAESIYNQYSQYV